MSLYAQYAALLDGVLDELVADGALPAGLDRENVTVEPPRDPAHGDLATNAAMVLAKAAGTNPRALAEAIKPKLEALPPVTSVEIAGPGFINIRLTPDAWRDELRTILARGRRLRPLDRRRERAGQRRICLGQPDRAAAHGPLPRRGGRRQPGAACSKRPASGSPRNIMSTMPARRSIRSRARCTSATARRSARTSATSPRACIPGDYLKPVGHVARRRIWRRVMPTAPEGEWLPVFREAAIKAMLDLIRHDLALLGIHHDLFSSEAELQRTARSTRAMEVLRAKGLVYEGTLERPKSLDPHDEWEPVELTLFRSSAVRRRPGPADEEVGRQLDLFRRRRRLSLAEGRERRPSGQHLGRRPCRDGQARPGGGEGADRRPRRPRRQAGPDGAAVPRRRAGEDVASAPATSSRSPRWSSEVGKDVVRFMMLTRRADAPLDFDFAKVVEASKDNPVFYVQYAHARISSLQRKAAEAGVDLAAPADLSLLDDEELALVKRAAQYPRVRRGRGAGARAAPDRLLPLRSRGRVPRLVEPRQRRSGAPLPR